MATRVRPNEAGRPIRQRVGRQPVHVIPAGADPASASAAEAPRPERYAASVVVLCVGAFIPRKGHDMLLRAVERLRQIGRAHV